MATIALCVSGWSTTWFGIISRADWSRSHGDLFSDVTALVFVSCLVGNLSTGVCLHFPLQCLTSKYLRGHCVDSMVSFRRLVSWSRSVIEVLLGFKNHNIRRNTQKSVRDTSPSRYKRRMSKCKLRIKTKIGKKDRLVDKLDYTNILDLQKVITVRLVHRDNYEALKCRCSRTAFDRGTHLAEVHCTCATKRMRDLICKGNVTTAEYLDEWRDRDDWRYS